MNGRFQAHIPLWPAILLLALTGLGCGLVGVVPNLAAIDGPIYWAAATSSPPPTVTVYLGTTTPVVPQPRFRCI